MSSKESTPIKTTKKSLKKPSTRATSPSSLRGRTEATRNSPVMRGRALSQSSSRSSSPSRSPSPPKRRATTSPVQSKRKTVTSRSPSPNGRRTGKNTAVSPSRKPKPTISSILGSDDEEESTIKTGKDTSPRAQTYKFNPKLKFSIPEAKSLVSKYKEEKFKNESNKHMEALRAYEFLLREKIMDTIKEMSDENKIKGRLDINLNGVINVGGKDKYLHNLQYGFIVKDGKWGDRKPILMEEDMPFRKLQKELLEKGYYLLDESNPKMSKISKIVIYATKPTSYNSNPVLWHGKNVLL